MSIKKTTGVLVFLSAVLLADVSHAKVTTVLDADARILSLLDDRRPEYLSVYTVDSNVQRSLIRFDLSDIASGQVVANATLTLYSNISFGSNPSHRAMDVFRVTTPWEEDQATWSQATDSVAWATAGGDFVGTGYTGNDPYATSNANPTAYDEAVTWDITGLVQEWLDGTDNNGLLLKSEQGNYLHFRGSGYVDTSVHPKLELTFPPVPEPTTLAIWGGLGGLGLIAMRRRRQSA